MWIFGYGSLIWKVDFPITASKTVWVSGWARRLWQGSTDHRGTPGAPGRVATLLRMEGEWCGGVAHKIAEHAVDEVLAHLDHRESGGYERYNFQLYASQGGPRTGSALAYVATPDNPEYLGEASARDIAAQVARSYGPSGQNREYVIELQRALEGHGIRDTHIEEVAALLNSSALDKLRS